MIEDGFRTYLAAQTTVTAYVGVTRKRIAAMVAPEDYQFPFIVVTRTSTQPFHSMAGGTGLVQVSMDVDIYSTKNTSEVLNIVDAIRLKLDGYDGLMGTDVVQFCLLRGWSPSYLPPTDGREFGVFSGNMNLDIMYEETAASFA